MPRLRRVTTFTLELVGVYVNRRWNLGLHFLEGIVKVRCKRQLVSSEFTVDGLVVAWWCCGTRRFWRSSGDDCRLVADVDMGSLRTSSPCWSFLRRECFPPVGLTTSG